MLDCGFFLTLPTLCVFNGAPANFSEFAPKAKHRNYYAYFPGIMALFIMLVKITPLTRCLGQ